MSVEIISALVGLICGIISSIATFLLTKRKYNTEVEANQIQNLNEAFDLYKKTANDTLETQREMMESTIKSQNIKIEELQKENNELRSQVNQLQAQVFNLVKHLYSGQMPQDISSKLIEE